MQQKKNVRARGQVAAIEEVRDLGKGVAELSASLMRGMSWRWPNGQWGREGRRKEQCNLNAREQRLCDTKWKA